MILFFETTKEQRRILLNAYPSLRFFVEKAIANATNQIVKEKLYITDKELQEYHDRRVLNDYDTHKRKCTQATKDKISKGLKATSERQGWKGMHLLPETIEKLRGHIVTKGTRDKISKGNLGQKRTEEQRKNLSKGHKGMTYKKREAKVN